MQALSSFNKEQYSRGKNINPNFCRLIKLHDEHANSTISTQLGPNRFVKKYMLC